MHALSKKPHSVETRVRRLADRNGYRVSKSRRQTGPENAGEFALLDISTGAPVTGWRYSASLEEIEAFLRD